MNRLCLKNALRGPIPPNGYRWKCPEDGWENIEYDYREWVAKAEKHYRNNGMAVPIDLEGDMQEQLCLTLDPGWCDYDDPNRHRANASMSWGDVVNGFNVFKNWLARGGRTVAQSEADRRALICSRCYMNVHIEGCGACQKIVNEVTGKLKTNYDYALRGCAVCKCVLRAKVHFPMETLDTKDERLQSVYPDFCWMKKTGGNYRG